MTQKKVTDVNIYVVVQSLIVSWMFFFVPEVESHQNISSSQSKQKEASAAGLLAVCAPR